MIHRVFVGLGANLGHDLLGSLAQGARALADLPCTRLVALSSAWRSEPIDAVGPDYLNAVACLETSLTPIALLDALQAIEQAHGRTRPYPNAPRTLDLDLLLFGALAIDTARLTVPHPRMSRRAFVLLPLLEIAPELETLAAEGWQEQRIIRVGAIPL